MKKAIFFAATAALVLSSCSSDEITYDVAKKDVKGPKAIEVNAYTPQTKAVATTLNVQNGFWANFTATGADEATYDGKIIYTPGADNAPGVYSFNLAQGEEDPCWPDDPNVALNVVAVGGATFDENPILDGAITVSPVTNATETANDVVTATFSKSLNDNGASAAVNLEFKHILAKVQFNGKGAQSGYDYRVVGLTFEADTQADTYDIATGEWSSSTNDAVTYNVFAPGASYSQQVLDGTTMQPILYDGTTDTQGNTGAKESADQRIMYAAPGTYTITVEYMTKPTAADDYEKNDDNEYITVVKTADVELVAGKANVINLTLPQDGKTPIAITTSVEGWDATGDPSTPALQ